MSKTKIDWADMVWNPVTGCSKVSEGLPVCSRCREESTLAHDKACALLAEARAEIEMLKHQLEDESMRADGMTTAHAEACAKNYRQQELIEQMRDALRAWTRTPNIPLCEAIKTTEAALEAAERVG